MVSIDWCAIPHIRRLSPPRMEDQGNRPAKRGATLITFNGKITSPRQNLHDNYMTLIQAQSMDWLSRSQTR